MLLKALSGLSQPFGALVAHLPSQCAVCHAWPSKRVCEPCAARFAHPVERCQRCALRVPSGVQVCGSCQRSPPALDACLAAVDYAYPWADVLADFKFRGDPGWAGTLAALMRRAPLVEAALGEADLVLPVPLSDHRLRERGFNQSALLARCLAGPKFHAHTLLRLHASDPQAGLARAQRLRNLRGAFAAEPSLAPTLRGLRVVLVDDVMTTGATLEAATLPLREAGVAHVTAVVLARTERAP